MNPIFRQLAQPGGDCSSLVHQALVNAALMPQLLEGLQSDRPRVKYNCAKVLRLIVQKQPESIYPHFDLFAGLLSHSNKIMQWEALFVLSHLACVDLENKFDSLFDRYVASIPGPIMITAANAIGGLGRVALAKPSWADRIAREILKVSRAHFQTEECKNVAIGHAIKSFDSFFKVIQDQAPILRFVTRQLKNSRPATRRKAIQFLKRHA